MTNLVFNTFLETFEPRATTIELVEIHPTKALLAIVFKQIVC